MDWKSATNREDSQMNRENFEYKERLGKMNVWAT